MPRRRWPALALRPLLARPERALVLESKNSLAFPWGAAVSWKKGAKLDARKSAFPLECCCCLMVERRCLRRKKACLILEVAAAA